MSNVSVFQLSKKWEENELKGKKGLKSCLSRALHWGFLFLIKGYPKFTIKLLQPEISGVAFATFHLKMQYN